MSRSSPQGNPDLEEFAEIWKAVHASDSLGAWEIDGNAQSEASDNPLGCDSVATTVVRTDAVTEEKIWQTKIGETIEREMYYSQDFSIVVTYGTAGAPLNITIYDDESNECGTIAEAKSSSASHRAELEAAAAQGGPALAATQPLVEDAEEDQGYVSG